MPAIHSALSFHGDEFRRNADDQSRARGGLRELIARIRRGRYRGGARAGIKVAASSWCASACATCSIPARRSWRSRQLAGHEHVRRRGPGGRASSRASAASSGRECVIVANDATVKGGTYYPITVKKHLRAQEIALRERTCPASTWSTPAAPSCRCRTRCFPDREHFGRIFLQPGPHCRRAAFRRSPS